MNLEMPKRSQKPRPAHKPSKPKPSPLSITSMDSSSPLSSPHPYSANSLNTPVVNLASPSYLPVVPTPTPYGPFHFFPSFSPMANLSPHFGAGQGSIFQFPPVLTSTSHLLVPRSPSLPLLTPPEQVAPLSLVSPSKTISVKL